eukprot:PhF_6_TR32116/c5_g1_i4/m.47524
MRYNGTHMSTLRITTRSSRHLSLPFNETAKSTERKILNYKYEPKKRFVSLRFGVCFFLFFFFVFCCFFFGFYFFLFLFFFRYMQREIKIQKKKKKKKERERERQKYGTVYHFIIFIFMLVR